MFVRFCLRNLHVTDRDVIDNPEPDKFSLAEIKENREESEFNAFSVEHYQYVIAFFTFFL
jgi:hypothetical protein